MTEAAQVFRSEGPAARGGLGLVIEAEARIAERIAAARTQAARILEAAEESARASAQRYAAELADAMAALEARVAAERDQQIAAIRAAADRRIARFQALTPERIEALAEAAVARVLDGSEPEEIT
jgi:hypothetical protein